MYIDDEVLNYDEKLIFTLRALYRRYGYGQFRMSNFEEYDLYAKNRSFLVSNRVLTFTDANGRLMALKPDVTLSIVKNYRDTGALERLCYSESIYRADETAGEFREIQQTGLECLGDISLEAEAEVMMLAVLSLREISDSTILDVSHMGFLTGLLDEAGLSEDGSSKLLSLLAARNLPAVRELCETTGVARPLCDAIVGLAGLYCPLGEALDKLDGYSVNEKTAAAAAELRGIYSILKSRGCSGSVNLDFTLANDMDYYNGVVFRGYVQGVPEGVLAGGRYDLLLQRFAKNAGAMGFAVYINSLERLYRDRANRQEQQKA